MTENLSPEPLADATHVDAADGGGTVESSALTLAELNKYLGSDFKDPATALKALKDTKDFVGKRKDDIKAELMEESKPAPIDESLRSDVQSLKRDLFFSQNPQYKGYEGLIGKLGANPAEVVASPEFANVYEKVKNADEIQGSKSVVSSNARLSQDKSFLEDAVAMANATHSSSNVADILARGINAANEKGQ